MKRDMDLIRVILMDIEANDHINGRFTISDADFGATGADRAALQYNLRLLMDAGYIEGKDLFKESKLDIHRVLAEEGTSILVNRLTWDGHEFLDTVRDPKVWQKTKDALKGVGGVGIDTIKDVAKEIGKAVINHQVKKHSGIDLGL